LGDRPCNRSPRKGDLTDHRQVDERHGKTRVRSGPCDRAYVKRAISLQGRKLEPLTDRYKNRIYPSLHDEQENPRTLMTQTRTDTMTRTTSATLNNLWVLLVHNDGELTTQDADGRVPMMARAGNDQKYLLVFKNVVKARQFLSSQEVDGAEPRMVVRANHDDIMRIARSAGVVGTLLDYDPTTQKYAGTSALA
jgi:hypothetical protein